MKIKVCGLTDGKQIKSLEEMGVDYTGLIFFEGSPRYVEKGSNSIPAPAGSKRIGVFVNEKQDLISRKIEQYQLKAVQLCGEEDPELCSALMRDVEVIKVVHVGDADDVRRMRRYEGHCDYFLLDTRSDKYGGSGKKFDWAVLAENKIIQPFFLSGGIDEDDFDAIASIQHPLLYGVDINSRFETSPGIKDINKVERFIKKIKSL